MEFQGLIDIIFDGISLPLNRRNQLRLPLNRQNRRDL